jgi:hypothetical protein
MPSGHSRAILKRLGSHIHHRSNFPSASYTASSATSLHPTHKSYRSSSTIQTKHPHARLLISGPNASGIVASFSQLLYTHSCDIIDCASESSSVDDLNVGNDCRLFFQRILFDQTHLNKSKEEVEEEILRICRQFGMEYRLVRCLVIECVECTD